MGASQPTEADLFLRTFGPDTEADAVRLINGYTAGWPYCRPVDAALLEYWRTLGPAVQPAHMLIAYRDGVPRAFLHGERERDCHLVHLLAIAPGALEEGVWLLARAEEQARAAGARWLCGPTCRSNRFYGGYVLGLEPYHPHWAVEVTEAFVRAGYHMTEQEALMVADLACGVPEPAMPEGYEIAEAPCEVGFGARAFRLVARRGSEEVAFCGAHFYPKLRSPRGGPVGQIGPVGTEEPHRGRGLATALVKLALRRLQQWGAAEALISTGLENYPALRAYEKAGFVRRHNQNEWQKPLRQG
jgi:GNAT superfamily N-acetyltransferase